MYEYLLVPVLGLGTVPITQYPGLPRACTRAAAAAAAALYSALGSQDLSPFSPVIFDILCAVPRLDIACLTSTPGACVHPRACTANLSGATKSVPVSRQGVGWVERGRLRAWDSSWLWLALACKAPGHLEPA